MFSFLLPRYRREGRDVLKNARKLLAYKRDILPADVVEKLTSTMQALADALRRRDRSAAEVATVVLDDRFSAHIPAPTHAGWRENTEVFVVAIVIALGVRAYFLQPFTIPTGSMQPTLSGITGTATGQPAPNFIQRVVDWAWHGRSYVDAVSASDDRIVATREVNKFRFFTYTEVQCEKQHFLIHAPQRALQETLGVRPQRTLTAGEPLARGYIETGDHVFVDKMSYHFRAPRRGEVFVFSTANIRYIQNQLRMQGIEGSQFYIKRLAGLPGDKLRIASPHLFHNDQPAAEAGFQRVMSSENGYRGYGNIGTYLHTPEETFTVPPDSYFALGDNSYNSLDSRYWGTVAGKDLMGCGFLVYWPFAKHFGFMR